MFAASGLVVDCPAHAFEVQTPNLGDVLAGLAGLFVSFQQRIRFGIFPPQSLHWRCAESPASGSVSKRFVLLAGGQGFLTSEK
jgi:hypothetical protein